MKKLKVGDPWGDDPLKYDLSDLIGHMVWKSKVEGQPKNKTVTLRMSPLLLGAVKEMAKEYGIPYQSLMRELIMEGISRRKNAAADAAEKKRSKARKKRA